MAIDRQGSGLMVLRILMGVFFIFVGAAKLRWLADTSILATQFSNWEHGAAAGSISAQYLHRLAIPYVWLFARLVPIGEIICGLAMVLGIWTPLFAFLAFFMALNFHLASGAIFHYAFLTSATGLPVLGGTLALAVGGVRLPLSLR